MQRPKSIALFCVVSLFFGVVTLAASWPVQTGGGAMGIVGLVVGILWIAGGLGLFIGDDSSRVLLLWLFAISFFGAIVQIFLEMYANGFAWLTNGVGIREAFEAARFALCMAGLYQLAGPSALAYCSRKAETAAEH